MGEFTPLKNYFGNDLAELLAAKIIMVYPAFDKRSFLRKVASEIDPLELKPRVRLIANNLKDHLPLEYPDAIEILLRILGPENKSETGMFREFYWLLPVANFVELHGVDHFTPSINAIREITKRNTGEYAIRPFLLHHHKKTLNVMYRWSKDKNFHLRRLSSEGVRPRLPWAAKLDAFITDPTPIFPILENLKDDASLFVRKSVANNLNDILKDNYDHAMPLILKWSRKPTPERNWIIRHALRTQVKKKNKEALQLLKHI